jgi:hypothetical protein
MALLFGVVHVLFAGGFCLDRLYLAAYAFHRFLGASHYGDKPDTYE